MSTPKNFCVKKIVGQKNCWVQTILSPNKFWVRTRFGSRQMFGPTFIQCPNIILILKNDGSKKSLVQQKYGPEEFKSSKIFLVRNNLLSKNNDHPVPFHYGSLCILELWITLYPVTLSAVSIDHPLYCDYESLCNLSPWITLYCLSVDHPVFFDYGQWSPCIL